VIDNGRFHLPTTFFVRVCSRSSTVEVSGTLYACDQALGAKVAKGLKAALAQTTTAKS
jgi:hypothetical protein